MDVAADTIIVAPDDEGHFGMHFEVHDSVDHMDSG